MSSVNEKMTAIADNIRQYTGRTEKLGLDGMAEGIHDVHEKGKQEQYDAFWDSFQQNGARTDYTSAFGPCWTPETFRPKYPIRPTNAYFMFFSNNGKGLEIEDFVEFSKEHNIVLDYSQCTRADYGIACLKSKHYGVLDFSKCTNLSTLFYGHNWGGYKVETIDKFVSSEQTVFATNTFQQAASLTNITFDGVIATDINFGSNTKLSKDSITSIINHLSTTTSGKSVVFTLGAVDEAFRDEYGRGSESDEWANLESSRQNWTINLW